MGRNAKKVYDDNPSTTVGSNDLIYVAKSPYGSSNDSGIKKSDLLIQLNGEVQLPSTAKVTGLDSSLSGKMSTTNPSYSGALTGGDASFGQVDVANALNANGGINLPAYTPTEIFVSTNGSDINNGQIIQPLRHVVYADTNAIDGSSIFVSPGTFSEGTFLKRVGVSLFGVNKYNTFFTSSGVLGIDNSQWISSVSPKFEISNITLNGTSTSFYPSIYVSDSTQIFSNGKIIPYFSGGLVTNLTIENQEIDSPQIKDVVNCVISNGSITSNGGLGYTYFYSVDSASVPVITIKIENQNFNNGNIVIETGNLGSAQFVISILSCKNINQIIYNDNLIGISSTLTIDPVSYPYNGINDLSSGFLTVNKRPLTSSDINADTVTLTGLMESARIETYFIRSFSGISAAQRILESNLVSTPYTSASVTFSSADLVGGIIAVNPSAPQTTQLPTAVDFDAAVGPLFPDTVVPVRTIIEFTVENISTTALAKSTITPNTNFTIATANGAPVIDIATSGNSCKNYKAMKDTSIPSYVLFGG